MTSHSEQRRERTFSAEFHGGVRATLTVSLAGGMRVEWDPEVPRGLAPARREAFLDAYRIWRDECLNEFAKDHGLVAKTVRVGTLEAIAFCRREGSQS